MFNKLFTKILDSSIWLEPVATRIVWITLLAAMDEDGYAHFSAIENLAARARVSVEEVKKAIDCFLAPDPNSGNPDNEGRRVERVPGGFLVLNAKYHRDAMNRIIQREQTRVRVANWRAKDGGRKKERVDAKTASEWSIEGDGSEPNKIGPLIEDCRTWLADVQKNGADYTEKEMRGAWLALNANGWMWGKNPITDWRSALERQIQTDRSKHYGNKTNRGSGAKRTNLTEGTRNEGKGHLYRNAAVKGMADIRGADAGKDATGSAEVSNGTQPGNG